MTGDQDDVHARLRQVLPPWFGREDDSPVLSALLEGAAWVLSYFYSLFAFAKLQTRIATASGGWLDLASGDFFGQRLRRFGGELDAIYSRRIRLEVLRDRNTRNGIDRAVFDMVGRHPTIFEGFRPADCAAWGIPQTFGCGVYGAYGSVSAPFQVIITVSPPRGYGIPNRPGWNDVAGGLDATFTLASELDVQASGPTQPDLLDAIERVRSAGVVYFVRFKDPDPTPAPAGQSLDLSDGYNSGLLPLL